MIDLLVPTLALDIGILNRMVDSIDIPIDNKIVINNGRKGALNLWKTTHPGWQVLDQPVNLGVAGSWNLAPKLFPNSDHWLIVNDDIQFFPGKLAVIDREAEIHAHNHPVLYLHKSRPFWGFVWTARGVRDYGTFDENFWPAYYEDYEMRLRFDIGQEPEHYIFVNEETVIHGKPSGGTNYNAMIQGCGLFNRLYFLRKWGILDDHDSSDRFQTPYNITAPLSYWVLDEEQRAKQMAIWNAFWSTPNPSIYT